MLDSLGLADDSLSSSTAGGFTSPARSQQLKPGVLSPGPLGKGLVGLSGSTASSGSYPAGSLGLPPLPHGVKAALLPSQQGLHGADSQPAGPDQLGQGLVEDHVYGDAEDEIMTITSSEGTEQALAEAVAAMEDPDSEGASQHRLASSADQMAAYLQPRRLSVAGFSALITLRAPSQAKQPAARAGELVNAVLLCSWPCNVGQGGPEGPRSAHCRLACCASRLPAWRRSFRGGAPDTEREAGADKRCCAAGQDRWRRLWGGISRTGSVPSAGSRCAAQLNPQAMQGAPLGCAALGCWSPANSGMHFWCCSATAVEDSTCPSLLQALHGTLAKTNSQATARFIELQQMKMELLQRQAALSPHASAYSSLVRAAAVPLTLLSTLDHDA